MKHGMHGSKGNKSEMGRYTHKSTLAKKSGSMIGKGSGKSPTRPVGNTASKKMCT